MNDYVLFTVYPLLFRQMKVRAFQKAGTEPDVILNTLGWTREFGLARSRGHRPPEETLEEAAEGLALVQDIIEDRAKDLTERLVEWVMGAGTGGRGGPWDEGLGGVMNNSGLGREGWGKIGAPSTFERIGPFGLARSRGHRPPEETFEEAAMALDKDIIEDRAKDLTERLVAWVMGAGTGGRGGPWDEGLAVGHGGRGCGPG